MKKVFSILLGMTLMFSLVGCGTTGSSSSSGGSSDNKSGVYAEDGYGEGEMGDVMHTYFFDYVVNSAYICSEYEGYEPEEGNKLLVADVTVKNTSGDTIEMYDSDFQVQWGGEGDDDFDLPITYYEDAVSDEQLPEIYELKHRESRTGLLVFEVPEDSGDEYSISYLEAFDDDTEGDTFFVYFDATEK